LELGRYLPKLYFNFILTLFFLGLICWGRYRSGFLPLMLGRDCKIYRKYLNKSRFYEPGSFTLIWLTVAIIYALENGVGKFPPEQPI